MSRLTISLACIALVALPWGASAQRLRVRTGADTPYSECFCRAKGQFFEVGQTVCLRSAEGPRLATCSMDQNVTSWRFSARDCPET